jgi:hypothetical protein
LLPSCNMGLAWFIFHPDGIRSRDPLCSLNLHMRRWYL